MTRRSFAWSESGSSSTWSKKRVPPAAASRRPTLAAWASVKAPFSWPNSSDSSRSSGMAGQSTFTKGAPLRPPRSCSRRATRSLPVPLSPCNSTGLRVSARRSTSCSTAFMATDTATRPSAAAGAAITRSSLHLGAGGAAPQPLEVVEHPHLRREQVHHEVRVVEQEPLLPRVALDVHGTEALAAQDLHHCVRDRHQLLLIAGRGKQEIVREARPWTQVEDDDVLRLLVEGGLGGGRQQRRRTGRTLLLGGRLGGCRLRRLGPGRAPGRRVAGGGALLRVPHPQRQSPLF